MESQFWKNVDDKAGLPKAELEINEHWFSIIFKRKKAGRSTTTDKTAELTLSERDKLILDYCREPRSRKEILLFIGISNTTRNYQNNIQHLLDSRLLLREQSESTTAPNQRYIISNTGLDALSMH